MARLSRASLVLDQRLILSGSVCIINSPPLLSIDTVAEITSLQPATLIPGRVGTQQVALLSGRTEPRGRCRPLGSGRVLSASCVFHKSHDFKLFPAHHRDQTSRRMLLFVAHAHSSTFPASEFFTG